MSDLFRWASTWLQAWHEPAMVGLAVSLFGLAYLLPLKPAASIALASGDISAVVPPATASVTAFAQGLYDIPADDKYYRDQWIAETEAFYAANPPKADNARGESTPIRTASVRTPIHATDRVLTSNESFGELPESAAAFDPAVTQATDAEPLPAAGVASETTDAGHVEQRSRTASQSVLALSPQAQRWRVVTCLAAGLLASLLFVSVWPPQQSPTVTHWPESHRLEILATSEAVPLRIPSAWIGLRPTVRQLARRGVLSGSYVIALCGAWGIAI